MEFNIFTFFNSRVPEILTNDILFGRSLIRRICILKSVTGSLQKMDRYRGFKIRENVFIQHPNSKLPTWTS